MYKIEKKRSIDCEDLTVYMLVFSLWAFERVKIIIVATQNDILVLLSYFVKVY